MKQTKQIALGGVTAALALVILLLGGLIGVGTYAAPVLASFTLLPVGALLGRRLHIALWLAVSVLAILLVPDVEMALLFFCPVGCWPVLRSCVLRLPHKLQLPAKVAFFLLATLLMEGLITLLILPGGMPLWLTIMLLALGCIVFVLYDRLIPVVQQILVRRLSFILKR